MLSQPCWAAVPDKEQYPSQNKQSFCTEVQAFSPCRRWTPVSKANTPLCWQRVYSVTIIFWGWITSSSDLCLRGWRAAAITEPPVHYKGTFIWQVIFTWEIIFQHCRGLNLLPANSAPTPFSLWLYRHFHEFFRCPFEEKCIQGRWELMDFSSWQVLPAYSWCGICIQLKQWIAIEQEALPAFPKRN